MVRDAPDFGAPALTDPTYPVTDLGELAARIDSIVTYDRRGTVIWYDGFEDGIEKWTDVSPGAGDSVVGSTGRPNRGNAGVLLTSNNGPATEVEARHRHYYPGASRIGLEFSLNSTTNFTWVVWKLLVFTGTRRLPFEVRYRADTDTLEYLDSTGAYVSFATSVPFALDETLFHPGKLVVDPAAEEYVRFLFDGRSYSLKDIAPQATADTTGPYLEVSIRMTAEAAALDQIYADDVIITVGEPP